MGHATLRRRRRSGRCAGPAPAQPPLDEAARRRRGELADLAAAAALLLVLPAAAWWGRALTGRGWLAAALSAAAGGYLSWRCWQIRKRLKKHLTGRQAERSVAEVLALLKADGCRVLNSVPFPGGGIDHIVIGPYGVFSVETKVRTGAGGRPCRVDYDGNRVLVNGLLPERDPIAQARRQARWLAEFAKETAGADHGVRPVVWYVDAEIDGKPEEEVWVVNERLFPLFLKREPARLSAEEISRLREAFARVARSTG